MYIISRKKLSGTFIERRSSHVVKAQCSVHVINVLQESEEVLHLLESQALEEKQCKIRQSPRHRAQSQQEAHSRLTDPEPRGQVGKPQAKTLEQRLSIPLTR